MHLLLAVFVNCQCTFIHYRIFFDIYLYNLLIILKNPILINLILSIILLFIFILSIF